MKFFDRGSGIIVSRDNIEESISKQNFVAEISLEGDVKIFGSELGSQIFLFSDVEEPIEPDVATLVDTLNTWQQISLRQKMTTSVRLSLPNPTAGIELYDTDINQPVYFDGTLWHLMGGHHFAEIFFQDTIFSVDVNNQDTLVQVFGFDQDGHSFGAIPDHTNDNITIVNNGKYLVSVNLSASSSQVNAYDFIVLKNNGISTECSNLEIHRTTSTANRITSSSTTGICDFKSGDTIEIWVERVDGGGASRTINIHHINLLIKQIDLLDV